MTELDRERILSSTPEKRLIVSFNKLQESNLTEEAAAAHKALYENMPLSFIIENSRYIFAEPIYGLDFYKNAMLSNEYGAFSKYISEGSKIDSYIAQYGERMKPEMRDKYVEIENALYEKCNNVKSAIFMADDAIKTTGDTYFERDFSNAMYAYDKDPNEQTVDRIYEVVESTTEPSLYFTYAPYAHNLMREHASSGILNYTINNFFNIKNLSSYTEEDFKDPAWWETFVESSVYVNKLITDEPYAKAVSTSGPDVSAVFEFVMTNPIDFVNQLYTKKAKPVSNYVAPEFAVNNLFNEAFIGDYNAKEKTAVKLQKINMESVYYNKVADLIAQEELLVDDPDDILSEGYNLLEGEVSLSDVKDEVGRLMVENDEAYFFTQEGTDKKISDETKEKLNKTADAVSDKVRHPLRAAKSAMHKAAKGAKNLAVKTKGKLEKRKIEKANAEKVDKPEAGIATKVRTAAQDAEAKELQVIGKARKIGGELKTAGKAVAALPGNIGKEVDNLAQMWDDADTERRKKYLTKPGFRHKIYANLKKSMMYKSVASFRLTWVPFLWMARRAGKKKDKRIRDELIRELTVEIDICKDKIAESQGHDKHELMRMKSKMEAELVRLKVNTKAR